MDLILRRDSFTFFLRLNPGSWHQLLSLFLRDRVQTIPKRHFSMKLTNIRKCILSGSVGCSNLMDNLVVPLSFFHPFEVTNSSGTRYWEKCPSPSLHPFTFALLFFCWLEKFHRDSLWNDQVRLTVQSFAPNIYSFPVKTLKYTFWLF